MGCTTSKLDNEDTVRRCKERRRLIKEAVLARHHLASAHSDYCRSLRVTGSALSTFAAGEPLPVSDQTPAVFLHSHSSRSTTNIKLPPPWVPSPSPSLHSPPFSPPIPSSKLPHILSSSGFSNSGDHHQQRQKLTPKPMKLPHILSESSPSSSPISEYSHNPNRPTNRYTENSTYNANSTYSSTPSQASSVWNWENFYPPSPPDSEFFQRRDAKAASGFDDYERAPTYSSISRYKPTNIHKNQVPHHHQYHLNHHLNGGASQETEREEVQCSEWGDHYSSTSSSHDEGDDLGSPYEMGTPSNFGSSVNNEPEAAPAKAPSESKFSTMSKSDKSDDTGSSVSWKTGGGGNSEISDMKTVIRHKDLAEIVAALKEYFDNAAGAGEQVSEMLETGRAQLDRSFRQLKKTVYHSSGVFNNLRSSWTSKPPLAVKYRFEPGSIDEPGCPKSLFSTMERLLAWEKKLYQEVKAREGVKIEHEKKLLALQSQEYRGDEEAKLDKTKASIKRLQSLIVVTSQAVSTTSSAIIGLRDSELVPQLVKLCHGFMYMWRSMYQFHEVQNEIVQQVRGLVNRSLKGESTTDLHRQATRDLESAVSAWHSSFCCLVKFQRDFICSLRGWFKLTLVSVNGEPPTNGSWKSSEAFAFCDEWKSALDRLPDTVASEAIKSFINVVHSISIKQAEELKIKRKTESASKALEKKASSLRTIEKKYYQSYSVVGLGVPDIGPDNGHAFDARDPLTEKKSELAACQRRVEDEMLRHSMAVEVTRAMTLNNIQTGLPGVFQAMTSFSALIMEALEVVCNRSHAIK